MTTEDVHFSVQCRLEWLHINTDKTFFGAYKCCRGTFTAPECHQLGNYYYSLAWVTIYIFTVSAKQWQWLQSFTGQLWASLVAQQLKESTCRAGDLRPISGSGRSAGEGIGYPLQYSWASLVAQLVKNLQCGKPGINPCVGRSESWRSECLPTLVFWPGEFHGLYSPWSHKESDTTEWLSLCFTSQDNSRVYLREELAEGIRKC